MGILARNLRTFPPSQRDDLGKYFQVVRRRLDQNLDAVSAAHNATTTLATLTAHSSEVDVGTVLHFQVAGTLTNDAGANITITPLIALNGTTVWTDTTGNIADASGTEGQAFILDGRITWITPSSIYLHGFFMLSPPDVSATTGTGDISTMTGALAIPFYHTLSSQHIARDHIITTTLAISNNSGASASKRFAALWAE